MRDKTFGDNVSWASGAIQYGLLSSLFMVDPHHQSLAATARAAVHSSPSALLDTFGTPTHYRGTWDLRRHVIASRAVMQEGFGSSSDRAREARAGLAATVDRLTFNTTPSKISSGTDRPR